MNIKGTQYVFAQYADDTKCILDGSIKSLRTTLCKLEYFSDISGLMVKVERVRAICLGQTERSFDKICNEYDLNWTQDPFRMLGMMFSTNITKTEELNYATIAAEF